ncbi:3D domain-containing protein [Salinibacillus xinjiangensis]|uniref:3D domain-containing protein n=1 Tax=Salinibacillus xinjiangensis TaxID=1229268 RepID=A0A6G1X8M8_9BACI|nr:3D domain-containing protein [Salinibacillus xinjiangensis]MRG87289.1 hypothetical protein [Salinibacillus xinjiangensis]
MKKITLIVMTLVFTLFSFNSITADENQNVKIDDQEKLEKIQNVPMSDLAFEIGSSINGLMKWGHVSTELSLTSQELLTKDDLDNAKTMTMKATAYTAHCDGCSGITNTGINLIENPDKKVVAVDPNVIPLGTKLYVEGYGVAVAGDIGSAIKGNRIDLFIPSEKKANQWGVQEVKVKILG